jgi:hypothetical protein
VAISLSHIGEEVVAQLAISNPTRFIKALGLSNEAVDWHHVQSVSRFAYPNCKLLPPRNLAFDGEHRVDVVLWVKPESAVAIELKLDKTGLRGKTFNKRFLSNCGTSHNGSRITGNMIAILEYRSGCVPVEEGLYVELGDHKAVKLSTNWGLIVQQSVLDNWTSTLRPDLSKNALVISIQELVNNCGGKREFNQLVGDLITTDYFDLWRLDTRPPSALPANHSEKHHPRL